MRHAPDSCNSLTGTVFSVADPPPGVTYRSSTAIPITAEDLVVAMYAGQSPDNMGGVVAFFDAAGLSTLGDGDWLHPDGEISREPCESP